MALSTHSNTEILWQTASILDRVRLFESIYLPPGSNSKSLLQPIHFNSREPTHPQLQSHLLQLISDRTQQLIEATSIQLTDHSNLIDGIRHHFNQIDCIRHQHCVSVTTTACVGLICCVVGVALFSYLKR